MQESLEELIKRIISSIEIDKLDKRIEDYTDYKSKYVVLKPAVKVTIELTSGKIVKLDVTDYFEGEVK